MADQAGEAHMNARVEPDAQTSSSNSKAGIAQRTQPPQPRLPSYIMRFNFIVLIFVLTASGLVPLGDLLFAGFASVYFMAFGKLVYPPPTKEHPPRVFPKNRLLGYYIAFAGFIAIPIPVAYILGSFVKGDQQAMKSASPHLFLMACQVLTEIIFATKSTATTLPVRALVPVFYNSRRLFTIAAWLEIEFARAANNTVSLQWILFGRCLAAANFAIWAFNLFCFLLPIYLPIVMKKHYEMERLAEEHLR